MKCSFEWAYFSVLFCFYMILLHSCYLSIEFKFVERVCFFLVVFLRILIFSTFEGIALQNSLAATSK